MLTATSTDDRRVPRREDCGGLNPRHSTVYGGFGFRRDIVASRAKKKRLYKEQQKQKQITNGEMLERLFKTGIQGVDITNALYRK